MKRWLPVAVLLLTAASSSRADQDYVPIDSGDYASADAARAAWQPSDRGSGRIDVADDGGQRFLRLPCNFATNDNWRVAWDKTGRWDLSRCPTIEIEVAARNGRAADILLYFHSGDGWYSGHFAAAPGRSTVALARKQFGLEDKPGAWDRIDRVRLCVTRDVAADREVLVRNIRGVVADAKVAVYRNDDGIKAESGVPEYVRQMADRLDRIGVAYAIVGDAEVAAGSLAGMKLAILPLNPVLPKAAADAIEKFVAGGGRLIVCYSLPRPLDSLLGISNAGATEGNRKNHAFEFTPVGADKPLSILQNSWWAHDVRVADGTTVRAAWLDADGRDTKRPAVTKNANGFFIGHVLTPDGQAAKDELAREMIGELWPGMWEAAYRELSRQLATGGRIEKILGAITANLHTTDQAEDVANLKGQAMAGLERSKEFAEADNFRAAVQTMNCSFDLAAQAWATSIPPKPGETRAVWCHSPTGVAGLTWEQAMAKLEDAGFDAIIVNMLWGGSTAYPSKVLPRAPGFTGDVLADCLAAAAKHHIAVHVWKVNWNLAWTCPPDFRRKLRAAGRLQVGPRGEPIDWLCPSNDENQKLELDSILELVRNYDIAGFHFDYIRYPGGEGCFCPTCRRNFEQRIGHAVAHWPDDATDGPLRAQWLDFRRDNITRLVRAVAEETRRIKPGGQLQLSAAVFRNWQTDRDSVGQDWKLWGDRGWLDFVCPMQYTDSLAMFTAWTKTNRSLMQGHARLLTGIGSTLGLSPDGTLEQVIESRRGGADGFVLFNYSPELLDHLALLKRGATRPAAATQPDRP
ncbi:MAG: hypothetical protein BIFFINMI_03925 [Phycisphaerae bacterium]|nr:hypothetical protein [Phycisphaerae bacterium]